MKNQLCIAYFLLSFFSTKQKTISDLCIPFSFFWIWYISGRLGMRNLAVEYSDAPIIRSVISIGPIMCFSGQYRHRQIVPITWLINDACASQNHVLAILLLERCKWLCKALLDGATCHTSGEEGSTVTHGGSVTPGKRNTKTFILVQFDC